MTVPVEPIELTVVDPAQDGVYAFNWRWQGGGNLAATLLKSDGSAEQALSYPDDFTATPLTAATGGSLTLLADPTGFDRLLIRRATVVAQEFDAPPTAAGFEAALDRVTMNNQERAGEFARAVQAPTGVTNLQLPPLAPGVLAPNEALTGLRWLANDAGAQTVTATGGTAARTLADKLGENLSIRDRGVQIVGDQTGALQEAIDALVAAGGGTIEHPGGPATINGAVYVKGDNIHIVGRNRDDARFIRTATFNGPMFRWTAAANNGRSPTAFLFGGGIRGVGLRCEGFAEDKGSALLDICAVKRWSGLDLYLLNPYLGITLRGAEAELERVEIEYETARYGATPTGEAGIVLERNGSGASNFTSASGDYHLSTIRIYYRGTPHQVYPINYGVRTNYCDGCAVSRLYTRGCYEAGTLLSPAAAQDRVTGWRSFREWHDWPLEAGILIQNGVGGNCGDHIFTQPGVYGGTSATQATAYCGAVGNDGSGDNLGRVYDVEFHAMDFQGAGLNGLQIRDKADDFAAIGGSIQGSASRTVAGGAAQFAIESGAVNPRFIGVQAGWDGLPTRGTSASATGGNIKTGSSGAMVHSCDLRGNAAGLTNNGANTSIVGNVS